MSASRHVAPERWADLAAGRLDAETRAEVEAHASACERCRSERASVERARAGFASIRRETPALGSQAMGARVHWVISSELKRREREAERTGELARQPRRRWWPTLLVSTGVLAACGLGLFVWSKGGRGMRAAAETSAPAQVIGEPRSVVLPPSPAPAPVAPGKASPAPAAAPLEGLITFAEGQVLLDGAPLSADAVLRAGNKITTGAGRVHVQFGDASGFVLEPRSVLELAAFDARSVELRVEGAVGVQVAHRAPEQTFAVVAAGRRVEVRGTIFRVAGGAHGLEVEVTRGRVAVTDGVTGADAIEIPAGSWLQVPLAVSLAGLRARPMPDSALLAAAQRLRVSTLSVWPSRAGAQASSSLLRVSASAGTQVSIDDVPVGKGTVVLRVPPGRHLVKAGTTSRWIEVEPGVPAEAAAAPPEPTRRSISERARQVEDESSKHHERFEVCANRVRSVDPDYTDELVVEIDIGPDGSLRSVVAVKGLPDQATEGCMLDVIRQEFTFPPGSRDTVRKTLHF